MTLVDHIFKSIFPDSESIKDKSDAVGQELDDVGEKIRAALLARQIPGLDPLIGLLKDFYRVEVADIQSFVERFFGMLDKAHEDGVIREMATGHAEEMGESVPIIKSSVLEHQSND